MARRSRYHPVYLGEGESYGKIALYGIEKFTYLPEQNCYVCPEGKQLKYVGINALNRTHLYYSTPLWWDSYVGPQGAERSIELECKRHPAAADDHRRLESRQRTDMYPLVRRFRQTWSSSTVPGVNCVDGSQNVWQQMFTCDPFGNTKKSGSSSFQATYNGSNQITNLGRSIDGGNQRYRTRSNRTLLTPTFFMLVMDKVPWSTLPSSLR
jgi:hypothetical protein